MSVLVAGTNTVSMDEPCFSLKEVNAQSPDSRGFRRYQVLKVMRAGRVAELRYDLGAAASFTADEFVIPGGCFDPHTKRFELLHTVGELYDIANHLRSPSYHRPERPQPTDLITAYKEQPERRRKWRAKRSTFGPGAKLQRG